MLIGQKENKFIVERLTLYKTFKDMLVSEGVEYVVPDKKSIDQAETVYYSFYTKEQEEEFGVIAIKIINK